MRAATIASHVACGEITAVSITRATLARIAERNPVLNCFTTVFAREALAQARKVDAAIASGQIAGPLAGVPFAVKDLFDVAGHTTLAGSRIRREAAPALEDAQLVRQLKEHGAILVGTLNMDEFAYGFTTENAHYGVTRNPHDTSRIAGGSSGGSAAAVASGLVPLTLGSDTNGSIRVPAALCGVFGLKPTFGRLSRAGTVPFVHSLDHVGPFAGNAADLALAYRCLLRAKEAPPPCSTAAIRVGVLEGWFRRGATQDALSAVDRVAAAFENVRRAELPEAERARSAAFCLTAAEAGCHHFDDLKCRAAEYDPATRDRLIAGALLPARVILQAQRFRRWFQARVRKVFEDFDLLLAPTTPCAAPRIGETTIEIDGIGLPVRANLGAYTQPLSFVGLPVISVPVHLPGALPLGVQLIARPWAETMLLDVTERLEREGVVGKETPDDD